MSRLGRTIGGGLSQTASISNKQICFRISVAYSYPVKTLVRGIAASLAAYPPLLARSLFRPNGPVKLNKTNQFGTVRRFS